MQEITQTHHENKKHDFTLAEAFGFGWDRTKKYWAIMILIGAVHFMASLLFGFLIKFTGQTGEPTGNLSLAVSLINYIVYFWLAYNTMKMGLKMTSGHKVDIKELFHFDKTSAKKIGMYFLAISACSLVIFVGFILLIIPGIYFGVKYKFVPYLVLDKDMSIADAFKKSANMTDGKIWKLLGVSFVYFGVAVAGFVALVFGIIPAAILITFTELFIYRKLADGHVN